MTWLEALGSAVVLMLVAGGLVGVIIVLSDWEDRKGHHWGVVILVLLLIAGFTVGVHQDTNKPKPCKCVEAK